MSEENFLEKLIDDFMGGCQEDLFVLEQPFRDFVLSKFLLEAPKISLFLVYILLTEKHLVLG